MCSDTFFAHGGNFTLLKCETDVAFIERVNALSILL